MLKKFMYIFGLMMPEVSQQEVEEIERKIDQRNLFRSKKNYLESDKIRLELSKKFNIELIDHKEFTSWKKKSFSFQKKEL